METLQLIRTLDIYLLDLLLKEKIPRQGKILDAGCGMGRNFIPLHHLGFSVEGFDEDPGCINQLKQTFPELTESLTVSSIENFVSTNRYDFIVCNAVLHFARSHAQFEQMFEALASLLIENGTLFIRMTSNFATQEDFNPDPYGIAFLPDGSYRYLLTQTMLQKMLKQQHLTMFNPLKTVNVDNKRCMSTLVLKKN